MATQEQTVETSAAQTQPDVLATQLQQQADRMGMLTIQLVQGRDALADKERELAALTAEVQQRRLQVEGGERDLLRMQGAVGALQQLMQAQQEANDAG